MRQLIQETTQGRVERARTEAATEHKIETHLEGKKVQIKIIRSTITLSSSPSSRNHCYLNTRTLNLQTLNNLEATTHLINSTLL